LISYTDYIIYFLGAIVILLLLAIAIHHLISYILSKMVKNPTKIYYHYLSKIGIVKSEENLYFFINF